MRINVPARAQTPHCTVNVLVATDDKATIEDIELGIKDAANAAILRAREVMRAVELMQQ